MSDPLPLWAVYEKYRSNDGSLSRYNYRVFGGPEERQEYIEDTWLAIRAHVEAEPRWIPVTERLPGVSGEYLALHRNGDRVVAWYSADDRTLENECHTWTVDGGWITHWAPIQWPPDVAQHHVEAEQAHVEARCVWVRYPCGDAMDGSACAYRPIAHADYVPKLWLLDCEMRGWYNCPFCGAPIEIKDSSK